jgi:hypothetical protein
MSESDSKSATQEPPCYHEVIGQNNATIPFYYLQCLHDHARKEDDSELCVAATKELQSILCSLVEEKKTTFRCTALGRRLMTRRKETLRKGDCHEEMDAAAISMWLDEEESPDFWITYHK